jgi:protein-S-isoprenylcysteine O-methyltransferase Ste14
MRPFSVISVLWITWISVWAISALWANPTEKRVPSREEVPYRILSITGAALIAWGSQGVTGLTGTAGWSMTAIVAMGVSFALWARWHLGRFWSATVARKEDQRLIDRGPYALVRHPIYAGIVAALSATAVAEERALAVLGAILFAACFTLKARLEEKFLRREFGSAYEAYAARVPMLIPFWPRTG